MSYDELSRIAREEFSEIILDVQKDFQNTSIVGVMRKWKKANLARITKKP